MDDPFESPKLLIAGARDDIESLRVESQTFLDGCFGVPFSYEDPKTRDDVIKYRIAQKIPGRLRVLASNVVNNLRHALDHATNIAAVELGGKPRGYFPFAKNATDIDRVIADNCTSKGIPVELVPLLKGFKPYVGGDDLLYALNRIVRPNKHQVVLVMDMDLPLIVANGVIFSITGPAEAGFIAWDSARQEIEVARIPQHPPGGKVELARKAKFPLSISVRDAQVASGQPAPAFLDALASKVEGIVLAIEAETARLKGLR